MQNSDWTDHSSIYSQKHKTFYRWVLYPIILFLFLVSLFLFFAKKEVTVRTTAQLVAQKTEKLQIPIEAKIIENKLSENKSVKKGETLVSFDTTLLQNEKEQLEQDNRILDNQQKSANIFIESLDQEKNLFETDDEFGYSNQLKSLLAEKEAGSYESKQDSLNSQKEQEGYQKANEQLTNQISGRQVEQHEWEQIRNSWNNNQNIQGFSTDITSKYQSWQAQLSDASENQKRVVKATTLATIDDQVVQLKKEIEQLQGEKAKLVAPNTSDNSVNSRNEQLKKNKEQAISGTRQKITETNGFQNKNKVTLKSINEQLEQGSLKAPIDGTIHLNDEVKDQTEMLKGTIIAEIYPQKDGKQMTFTAYLPANEMTWVKTGMKVHFKLDKKGVAESTINGQLTEISENSVNNEKGTFYIIKGSLQPLDNFTSRYGLTGELSLIVGKKTYWQQIKDILLNL